MTEPTITTASVAAIATGLYPRSRGRRRRSASSHGVKYQTKSFLLAEVLLMDCEIKFFRFIYAHLLYVKMLFLIVCRACFYRRSPMLADFAMSASFSCNRNIQRFWVNRPSLINRHIFERETAVLGGTRENKASSFSKLVFFTPEKSGTSFCALI